MQFNDLNLHKHLLKNVEDLNFTTPTPVQQQAIPHVLEGKDVLACAQTGTGKTAAFTLPMAHHLMNTHAGRKHRMIRALILTPTRELAEQVLKSIKSFIKGSPINVGSLVGGVSYNPQINMLAKGVDIIVATPGRLIDHMAEGRINLSAAEFVVLDEADRMLDMGFIKPVEKIMSQTSKEKQTLLFSATFDKNVEKLAKQFLKEDHEEVKLAPSHQKHENIEQSIIHVKDKDQKAELLEEMLESNEIWQAIVFMRSKHATDRLAAKIRGWGHKSDSLHGDMRQSARKRVVEKMHKGDIRVLVATDVAARGLDVKALTHVINFDLPQMSEDYVHRIGRTGRAGAKGTAISFVSKQERNLLKDIEKLIGQSIFSQNAAPADDKKKPAKKKSSSAPAKKPASKGKKPNRNKGFNGVKTKDMSESRPRSSEGRQGKSANKGRSKNFNSPNTSGNKGLKRKKPRPEQRA